MELIRSDVLKVSTLGPRRFPTPVRMSAEHFVDDERRVLVCNDRVELQEYLDAGLSPASFLPAGPRTELFFDPSQLTCGIVTCGGLCPGLNDVIRALTLTLTHRYGVREVLGFRYGYAGLGPEAHEPMALTQDRVKRIHEHGGTILGSSRGPQELDDMIRTLVERKVGVLFTIGGDGTLKGASALAQELLRRELPIGVIGIPKTIDNDLLWVVQSFGFSTAVEEARRAIAGANAEAEGGWNGVGIVKLMGRHSGFIAAHASLSNPDVNFCLIPEVPFALEGQNGFLQTLERRLNARHHAVVVIAEGAGQDMLATECKRGRDASGNVHLDDVGTWLCERIKGHCTRRNLPMTIKYIDPSYAIRSLPANALDSEYCLRLGQHAAHAAVAGGTDAMVGYWNQHFTLVPLTMVAGRRKRLDPASGVWQRVLENTGQPASMI